LIGVDDYKRLTKLEYCGEDVRGLGERFVAAGFEKDRVVVLHKKAASLGHLPMKVNIEEQISLVLGSAKADDLVVLSFSGHGVRLGGKSYLCPYEADLDDPSTLVPLDTVYRKLEDCPAALKLFLVDACQNDVVRKGERSAEGTRSVDEFAKSISESTPRGTLLLTSCAPGQKSRESEEFKHGVFMHYVLEGLGGPADGNKNGTITLSELFGYASDRTNDYVRRKYKALQLPAMQGRIVDFPLVDADARAIQILNEGHASLQANKWSEALTQFQEAARLVPVNPEPWFWQGMAHRRLNDRRSALVSFEHAISIKSDHLGARLFRASCYEHAGEDDRALAEIGQVLLIANKSIADAPSNADLYVLRGLAYGDRGRLNNVASDLDKAIADTTEAIRLDPHLCEAYRLRAIAHNNLKKFDEAIADCDKAVSLDAQFADLYRVRAYAYCARGKTNNVASDLDKAIADTTEAIRLNPKNAAAYLTRAETHLGSKRYDESVADCDKGIVLDPKSSDLYRVRAHAYGARGETNNVASDFEKAIADATEAIRLNPKDAAAYLLRALVYIELKRYNEAVADCDEALRLDPNDDDAKAARSRALENRGRE
jgi:tetratricopeptide (TPR) repeat protein